MASLLATAVPAVASAQQGAAAADAAALSQRTRGLQAMRAGNHAEAIAAFERSLSIVESPNTRLDLGRAHLAAGHVASALRELERARDTGRARVDAGQAQYTQTVRTAAAEADALRPRVPLVAMRFSQTPPANTEVHVGETRIPASAISEPVPVDPGEVRFRVSGPAVRTQSLILRVAEREHPSVEIQIQLVGYVRVTVEPAVRSLRVEVDGQALDAHSVGRDHELAPGTHQIRVSAPGFAAFDERREVAAGEHANVEVTLQRAGGTAAATTGGTVSSGSRTVGSAGAGASTVTPVTVRRGGNALPVVGIVMMGAGAVGMGVGLSLWALADSTFNALVTECPGGPCTGSTQIQRASDAQTLETVGIAAMIGGGVLLGGGLGVFLGGTLSRERPPVAVSLTPRSIVLGGTF